MPYIKSYTFGEDLAEHTLVKFSEENTVVKLTSPLDKPCGVTLFAGKKGACGDVVRNGKALVNIAGAVSAGDFLMTDTDGKAIALNPEADELKPVTGEEQDTQETQSSTETTTKTTAYVVGQVEETTSSDAILWANINIQPLIV